jgi:hypothetical protein
VKSVTAAAESSGDVQNDRGNAHHLGKAVATGRYAFADPTHSHVSPAVYTAAAHMCYVALMLACCVWRTSLAVNLTAYVTLTCSMMTGRALHQAHGSKVGLAPAAAYCMQACPQKQRSMYSTAAATAAAAAAESGEHSMLAGT